MAQVPYQGGVSDVQPDARPPDDYLHVDASPAAFGGAIGQGLEKAGAGALDLSKYWDKVQAQDASNKAEQEMAAVATHVSTLEGQDALDAKDASLKKLDDITTKYAANLSPEAELQFNSTTTPYKNRFIRGQMDTTFVRAGRTVAEKTNSDSFGNAIDMATTAGSQGDWKNVEVARAKAFMAMKIDAQQKGVWNETDAMQSANEKANAAYASAIEARAMTNPDEAWARLQIPEIRNALGSNADKVEAKVKSSLSEAYVSKADALATTNPAGAEAFVRANEDKFGSRYGEALDRAHRASLTGGAKSFWDDTAARTRAAPPTAPATPDRPGVIRAVGDSYAQRFGQTAGVGFNAARDLPAHDVTKVIAGQDVTNDRGEVARGLTDDQIKNTGAFVLSSGAANARDEAAQIQSQIEAFGRRNVDPSKLWVMGVAPTIPGADEANRTLQALAEKSGAHFRPIAPGEVDADRIHPTAAAMQTISREISGSAVAAPKPQAPVAPGRAEFAPGSFDSALGRTFKEEGGYNARDANGAPVNFGINQAAHPEVDVSKLTREQAAQIYKRDYWDKIDGDNIARTNPALAHVAFDAAVIAGPARAQQWVAQSGGDAGKFMDLRDAYLSHLVASDPGTYAKYARVWQQRDNNLRADIGLAPRGSTSFASNSPSMNGFAPPQAGGGGQETPQTTPAAFDPAAFTLPAPPASPAVKSYEDAVVAANDAFSNGLLQAKAEGKSPDELEAIQREGQIRLNFALAAADETRTQVAARERAATDDVLGTERKEGYSAAYKKLNDYMNDPRQPISEKQYDTLNEVLEKRFGNPNPVTLGPKYSELQNRIAAKPNDPNRLGDVIELQQAEARGDITWKGYVRLHEMMMQGKQSLDEFGLQRSVIGAYDYAERALGAVKDPLTGQHNQKAKDLYDLDFTNGFNRQYDDWKRARAAGKGDETFSLFEKKNMDAYLETIYSSRERAKDKTQDWQRASDADSDVWKYAPPGVDPKGWQTFMGMLSKDHNPYADRLAKLASNPITEAPKWDASPVSKVISAEKVLQLIGVRGPTPVDKETRDAGQQPVAPQQRPTPSSPGFVSVAPPVAAADLSNRPMHEITMPKVEFGGFHPENLVSPALRHDVSHVSNLIGNWLTLDPKMTGAELQQKLREHMRYPYGIPPGGK